MLQAESECTQSEPTPGSTMAKENTEGKILTVHEKEKVLQVSLRDSTFKVLFSNVKQHAKTRLANLSETDSEYDEKSESYVFDRSPEFFHRLLDFYRDGELHLPSGMCHSIARAELDFWGLEIEWLAPCCYEFYKHSEEKEKCLQELSDSLRPPIEKIRELAVKRMQEQGTGFLRTKEKNEQSVILGWRDRMWAFFEDPRSSKLALVTHFYL